jgi:hypothetical protein
MPGQSAKSRSVFSGQKSRHLSFSICPIRPALAVRELLFCCRFDALANVTAYRFTSSPYLPLPRISWIMSKNRNHFFREASRHIPVPGNLREILLTGPESTHRIQERAEPASCEFVRRGIDTKRQCPAGLVRGHEDYMVGVLPTRLHSHSLGMHKTVFRGGAHVAVFRIRPFRSRTDGECHTLSDRTLLINLKMDQPSRKHAGGQIHG